MLVTTNSPTLKPVDLPDAPEPAGGKKKGEREVGSIERTRSSEGAAGETCMLWRPAAEWTGKKLGRGRRRRFTFRCLYRKFDYNCITGAGGGGGWCVRVGTGGEGSR